MARKSGLLQVLLRVWWQQKDDDTNTKPGHVEVKWFLYNQRTIMAISSRSTRIRWGFLRKRTNALFLELTKTDRKMTKYTNPSVEKGVKMCCAWLWRQHREIGEEMERQGPTVSFEPGSSYADARHSWTFQLHEVIQFFLLKHTLTPIKTHTHPHPHNNTYDTHKSL